MQLLIFVRSIRLLKPYNNGASITSMNEIRRTATLTTLMAGN